MKTYYAASTGGFYNDSIHAPERIPKDAVELAGGDEERLALLGGMGKNKRIIAGPDGYPVLGENAAPSDEELADMVRAERDRRLRESDWTQLADVPEAERRKWAEYRQKLRDMPSEEGYPSVYSWPSLPGSE
jgi:hypothetical protein